MKPLRVLVVDDEPSVLFTLTANLELEGMDVAAASSAAEALELMRGAPFDLVLSDVRMPGMNGVELFREIRKASPNLPVILLTAYAGEALLDEALGEGAYAVLPKSFDMEALLPLLARAARAPAALIGDISDDAEATAAALRAMGVRAIAASDGPSALQTLETQAVDVCVLDLDLAAEGAPPLIDRLRALDPSLWFIVLMAPGNSGLISKIAAGGPVDWVRKPAAPRALVKSIANARGRPRAAPHPSS